MTVHTVLEAADAFAQSEAFLRASLGALSDSKSAVSWPAQNDGMGLKSETP